MITFCRRLLGICILAFPLLFPVAGATREAGWVPAPQNSPRRDVGKATPRVQPKTSATKRAQTRQAATKPAPAKPGATVYDNQPNVTEPELNEFVLLLPQFRSWARKNREEAHPVLKQGKPDFQFSESAAKWVREHNFDPARFFCIMGKMAAGLVIVEEGNDLKGTRPPDMPEVTGPELELVRRHLGELLAAGGPPQPIR